MSEAERECQLGKEDLIGGIKKTLFDISGMIHVGQEYCCTVLLLLLFFSVFSGYIVRGNIISFINVYSV